MVTITQKMFEDWHKSLVVVEMKITHTEKQLADLRREQSNLQNVMQAAKNVTAQVTLDETTELLFKRLSGIIAETTWTDAILHIVHHSPRGINYIELKDVLLQSALAHGYDHSNKLLYATTNYLVRQKAVVKYNEAFFTTENLKQFKTQLASGAVRDITVVKQTRPIHNLTQQSEIMSAIRYYLFEQKMGLEPAQIRQELIKQGYRAQMDPKSPYLSKLLSRLKNNREIDLIAGRYHLVINQKANG